MQTSGQASYPPLVIFGGGNMGLAIVRGVCGCPGAHRGFVLVVEPDRTRHPPLTALGVRVAADARSAMELLAAEETRVGMPGQLVLAIKPQMLGALADELRALLGGTSRVVITILAGTPSAKVREALGGAVRVVRAMPNLAVTIRKGTTAICLGAGAVAGDEATAGAIFADVGRVVVADESMMDAFTAVAGSGPAYVFYLAEAMLEAAEKLGFDRSTARSIVRETILGAAGLLAESPDDPGTLRAAVTSKGGTTEAALRVLESRGVKGAVVDALAAARDRGAELGTISLPPR